VSATGNVTRRDVAGNVTGEVTGDVTGDITGDVAGVGRRAIPGRFAAAVGNGCRRSATVIV
jgi:hypothetical protein